ncbi:Fur family transcriptional regulator [Nocardia sp. NPDC051570]|uniref:Fur family transcriptional regulator n=1 Tax=Nocardia sp. NPDC051570 TaxID=3364324 RepID=UPI0037AE8FD1
MADNRYGRTLLSEHGLRCTTPRLAVLEVLDRSRHAGHLTAAEIHRRLDDEGRRIDLTTVYRTVSTLVRNQVLHTLIIDERVVSVGLADRPHHHAICNRCATVTEVPAAALSEAVAYASAGSNFLLPNTAALTLHGLCPRCQRELRPN